MTKASVIICTHNPREGYLRRVLEGLRQQTLPPTEWELLLVDNASATPLADRIDLSWHPRARHVREEELGLTPARLRGISESTSEILVFVDDDTLLARNYLEEALFVGAEWPFVGAWGGSCIPEYETPLPNWVRSEVWRLTVLHVEVDVWSNLREGFDSIPAGAGMCIRRDVGNHFIEWCRLNRRSKALDRTGAELIGYGDVALAHCAIDLGLGTGRSKRLQLTHLIPATRLTINYFVRHAESDAYSLMMFRVIRGLPIEKPARLSVLGRFRWFIHRRLNRTPREQFEIQRAHMRGLEKGYEATVSYLRSAQSDV